MAIAVGAAVGIGVVAGHSFPDYDTTFALIWGHDLAHGIAPDYGLPYRPAGHPLLTFVAMVASPLGRTGAAEVVRWVVLLGAGALVAGVFRLGQALFGTAVGVLAAVLVFTRAPVWGFSLLGYMDLVAAALVVWAAVLEARSPKRGAPVLVLLALAGLLRPEVWLFAAVYWFWAGRSLRLAPLAAAGPVLWIGWDLVTSQTFLGSLTTESGAPVGPSTGGHGLGKAPDALVRYVGGFVRPPEAIAGAVGIALALAWARGRALLPLAVLVLNVSAFVVVAARNGPLEQRYLFPAATMVLLFAAYAVVALIERREAVARIAGILLAGSFLAYSPVDVDRIHDLRERVQAADAADSDLRDLLRECAIAGRIQVPDVRLRPFVAYWGESDLAQVVTQPPADATVTPADPVAQQLVSRSLPDSTSGMADDSWRLDGPCARQ